VSGEREVLEAKTKGAVWVIPVLLVFLLLATNINGTYLSISIYDFLPEIVLAGFLVCGGPWFVYFIWRYWSHRKTSPIQFNGKVLGPLSAVYYAILLGILLGFAEFLLLGIAGISLVRVTASTPVQFYAPISLRKGHGGRGCRYELTFYNRPVERDVMICGEDWTIPGAKNGDTLLVRDKVGPFGAHLVSLQRLPQ
jgi:hypothetical protein